MNYVMQPIAAHETPPVQHKADRRCAKCNAKVSRYQKKFHGILLCFRCQLIRLHGTSPEKPKDLTGLRAAMKRRGISQVVLATRLGVSPQSISELSRGAERASPKRATRVALALGAEVEELTA